jgi:hypothetical protein
MEIRDLFSHKIHSSNSDWSEKLIDIATIFAEFDGKPYDRVAIEKRLSEISPRASKVARDPSKFRDEISAYPAYLGLYRVEIKKGEWHIFLSNTAKQFLVCEEPNVAAFMLLQMILFQYPNGMGAAYQSASSNLRIQSNTKDRTLSFIKNGVHLSPLRLICKGLKADALIKNISPLNALLSLDEVFVLANHNNVNKVTNPNIETVVNVLQKYRQGVIASPTKYESRFHILNHTDFLVSDRNGVKLREAISKTDGDELIKKLNIINSITIQFNNFDNTENSEQLLNEIRKCSWGSYFDGVKTLEQEKVIALTSENPVILSELESNEIVSSSDIEIKKSENIYQLREFNFDSNGSESIVNLNRKTIYTDPEITRIKRQRANLIHKVLLEKLYTYLEKCGAKPYENEHIDLFAKLPSNEKYVFEVKSLNSDNLLSQTRKGVSQLYEYRYRYQDIIGYDVKLCLVFPYEPTSIPWLQEYLCKDREIAVIWFIENDKINYSTYCKNIVTPLIRSS